MFYYLYEIKNLINNKIYIGAHKTNKMDDNYFGSGVVLKNAIKKYGISHFEKTVLETFDTEEMMFQREKEIINDTFLDRDDVYNLRCGGHGGFTAINKAGLNRQYGKRSEEFSRKNSERCKQQVLDGTHPWQGKRGSEMSRANARKRIADGTHPFVNSEKQRELCMRQIKAGTHAFLGGDLQRKRVAEGTHHFAGKQGSELSTKNNLKMLAAGKHPSQRMRVCCYCNKEISSPNYSRWHGEKCIMNKDRKV